MLDFLREYGLYIALGIAWIFSLYLVRRKKDTEKESWLSNVFQTNKDLDTTLGLIGINLIVIFMLISFHDDLAEDSSALIAIFMGAFNLYQTIVHGKAMREIHNNNNVKDGK